jgi:hypothetical protein
MKRALALLDRAGGMLVAPRTTLRALDRLNGSGAGDALWLLFLKVLCGELRILVAAFWTMIVVGFGPGVTLLLSRVGQAVSFDLILMLGAGVAVTLLAGRKRSTGRDFDLAAAAWVPVLVVDLAAGVVSTVLGIGLPPAVRTALVAVSLGWMALLVVLSVFVARERA